MIAPLPQEFYWTGREMVPCHPKAAQRVYEIGQVYNLEHRENRSTASHNHEFAWLHEAWMTLPEKLADLYPTPEHLRKRALIEAGFFDEMVVDAGSNAAAVRVASAFRSMDDFSVVIVRGPAVLRRTAKSQSRRAMSKQEFQVSKTKIMEIIAEMLGTTPAALNQTRAA